jgi:hypothetical protein
MVGESAAFQCNSGDLMSSLQILFLSRHPFLLLGSFSEFPSVKIVSLARKHARIYGKNFCFRFNTQEFSLDSCFDGVHGDD